MTWYLPHIRFHPFDTMSSEQQSGPLSDADLYALKEWIAETAVSFLLYGIYATFTLIAMYFILYVTNQHRNL